MTHYFFDTYALIEITRNSKNYLHYIHAQPITTILNLVELYYALLRTQSRLIAERYYNFYRPSVVPISDEIIKSAVNFKFKQKRRKLSYVDCIGYIIAVKYGLKFLTGDVQFKNLPNVEFVK
ncbi:MAG: PIN domain-containing protein [Nanoarchaeota archaeon]